MIGGDSGILEGVKSSRGEKSEDEPGTSQSREIVLPRKEGGACEEHKRRKKGSCKSCGVCRSCDPSPSCLTQGHHINWRRKLKRMNPKSKVETQESFGKEERLRTKRRRKDSIDGAFEYEESSFRNKKRYVSVKEKLLKISSILGVDKKSIDGFPNKGISPGSIEKQGRNFSRARQVYRAISNAIKTLICPNDPSLLDTLTSSKKEENLKNNLRKVKSNLIKLSFFGSKSSRILSQSLMAASFTKKTCAQYLREEFEKLHEDSKSKILEKSRLMGSAKFTSLNKTFKSLSEGNEIPKQEYSSRVDSNRIANCIAFLQEVQPLKYPCSLRDLVVLGYLYKHIPIYSRCSKSMEALQSAYNNNVGPENRIGRQTFREVVKVMTKGGGCGETKSEISPHFMNFKHIGLVFEKMMKRVRDLNSEVAEELEKSWERIKRFLMWEFSNRHLKLSDEDALHCCTFALGENCSHMHLDRSCTRCAECCTFFTFRVKEFLEVVRERVHENSRFELTSMIDDALPKMDKVVNLYMAHRLRTFNHFNVVNRAKEELKLNRSKVLVLIDHKEKIFPFKLLQSSLSENSTKESYGKGICYIGSIEIEWKDGDFQHRYVDYVFKGHYSQDTVQVASVMENIVRNLHLRHPDVKEIIVQSDNASCFSDQELVPFIFNLNEYKENERKQIQISKWYFTDVQLGVSQLGSHFSELSSAFKAYVDAGNDIQVEEDIIKAISFYGNLKGTSVFLLNAFHLNGPIIDQKFKVRSIASRETGKICWFKDCVEITSLYDPGKLEKISSNHLYSHKNSLLITCVELQYMSPDAFTVFTEEHVEHNPSKEEALANPKKSKTGDEIALVAPISYPLAVCQGWATDTGNKSFSFSLECMLKLRELYCLSKEVGGKKVSTEEALHSLNDTVIPTDWGQQVELTTEKIKVFMQLSLSKMGEAIEMATSSSDTFQFYDEKNLPANDVVNNNDEEEDDDDDDDDDDEEEDE